MRNAEATKERILEAAIEEFSAYGIAGARVDRIAKNAGCNKNMIYIYFENKETLFITVLQQNLTRVYEETPFTPDDLPAYAARVFDFVMANPRLFRLMNWYGLEQESIKLNLTERALTQRKKIQELLHAQNSGTVGKGFTPGFILTTIMALATSWTATNPFGPAYDPDGVKNPDETRKAISTLISLMTRYSAD